MKFKGVDYYNIDELLSDEEKMTRNLVREFLEKEVEPLIADAFHQEKPLNMEEIAPKMAIELGMSSEFVLGLHGEIIFDGVRLAGMYPHDQVRIAETVGTDIFGPAINVKATKSIPWNLARAVTFVKETVKVASIPVHPNVGMGVCGLPMYESPPIDCTTRAAKALVEIGKADGL